MDLTKFLEDLIYLTQEKYDKALEQAQEAKTEADVAFQQGSSMAYYDVLDLIRSQLIAFGYELGEKENIVPIYGQKSPRVY